MSEKKSFPPGSPEALEEYRKMKAEIDAKLKQGRAAILDAAEFDDTPRPDRPDPEDGDDDGDAGDEGDGDPPIKVHRGIRFQKINKDGLTYWATLGPVGEDCPATPLGRDQKVFWFLTPGGQLVSYEDGKFGKAHITGLFAGKAMDWLMREFPAFSANGLWTGFKADLAQVALFSACDDAGVFDVREKVRGLGCWRGPDGELIQHLGNEVRISGMAEPAKPGMIGEFVYPGRPAVAPPLPNGKASAEAIFADFQTWSWSRGELDARMLLGWIGCAVLGAALDWRPMVFMTGDAGTGKSSLQERIKRLLPGRMASTVDASPAALRQIVNQDAIGVSFDEIEADMNSEQAVMVMKLARVAASGGTTYRGGSDHKASEFTLRGCFAFSAIVPPSMRVQDMQRMTFLRLQPLKKGGEIAEYTDAELKEHGQRLVGRMVEGWPRFKATLRAFELALQDKEYGHNQRGAKQFGTLLAAADLLLVDREGAPSLAEAKNLARGLARADLYEYESSDPSWLLVFRHIMSAPIEGAGKGGETVAEVVRDYLKKSASGNAEEITRVQRKLNRAGLAVVRARNGHAFLAIPPRHQAVNAMFRDTDFRMAGGDGAWTSALRNAPTYDSSRNEGVVRADKVPQLGRVKCSQIWLDAKVDVNGVKTPIFDLDPDADEAMQPEAEPPTREPGEEG